MGRVDSARDFVQAVLADSIYGACFGGRTAVRVGSRPAAAAQDRAILPKLDVLEPPVEVAADLDESDELIGTRRPSGNFIDASLRQRDRHELSRTFPPPHEVRASKTITDRRRRPVGAKVGVRMVKRREPVGQLGGEALDFRLEKLNRAVQPRGRQR